MKKIIITKQDENQRIDKYLLKIFADTSMSFIYKMIRKKNIKLNDKKANGNEILKNGDEIKLFFSDESFAKLTRKEKQTETQIDIDIVYEDEDIIVCNKPIGLLSQPDGKNSSLVDGLEQYLYVDNISGFNVGICNRLDRNTSGLIVAGKSIVGLQLVNSAFANREVEKIYHTIVLGVLEKEEILEGYISKDIEKNMVFTSNQIDGVYIKTILSPICNNNEYTFLEVRIITGKTHQIRYHLSSINHPIIGDEKYGDKKTNKYFREKYNLKSHLLHCYKIKFVENDKNYLLGNKEFVGTYPTIFANIKNDIFRMD